MKMAYELHERRYRSLREMGAPGWSGDETPAVVDVMLKTSLPYLRKYSCPGASVLELGCGDGALTLPLAERGFDMAGLDISPTAIAWAAEKARRAGLEVDLHAGSVLDVPFAAGTFDAVVDGHCAHCIVPGDREIFFREARRVLRPGGLFILQSLCGEPVEEEAKTLWDPQSRCMVKNGVAGRYFGTVAGLLREVEGAGFLVAERRVLGGAGNQSELVAACLAI